MENDSSRQFSRPRALSAQPPARRDRQSRFGFLNRPESSSAMRVEPERIIMQPVQDEIALQDQEYVRYNPVVLGDRRGWNSALAIYVKRLGQRSGGYKWMHGQASRYFTVRFQWIGVTSIIVNALATAGNIPFAANCQEEYDWVKIIAIILGFLVTIAMAYQQFKDYGSRRTDHKTMESNWAALYDHIMQQLHKNSRDRQEANDYIEWISKEFNDLKASSPLIPQSIIDKYRSMIDGRDIADPEGFDEIIIKKDSPLRVIEEQNELLPRTQNSVPSHHPPDLVEVIVEDSSELTPPPRAGRLVVTYNTNDDAMSEMDRIAFERWNAQLHDTE